jgi:hypothetical protein
MHVCHVQNQHESGNVCQLRWLCDGNLVGLSRWAIIVQEPEASAAVVGDTWQASFRLLKFRVCGPLAEDVGTDGDGSPCRPLLIAKRVTFI